MRGFKMGTENILNNSIKKINNSSKILVVGTSGSGKTTLARQLASKFQLNDIELDALFWKENWTQSEQTEFREAILTAQSVKSGFVIHGNYNKVRDLTWGKVDIVIWLDYPKRIVMWRVIIRSIKRILKSEELWAKNKESIKKTFFTKESIILWAWQTYDLRKKQYLEFIEKNEYPDVEIVRFHSPRDCEKFLNSI
jgi:adenylate kinase family enzyme